MSGSTPKTTTSTSIRVRTAASCDRVRFLSDVVQLYLVEAARLPAEAPATVRIRLAVMEAVTNVIRHGYGENGSGPLEFSMERQGDVLVITLADEAPRFDPFGGDRAGGVPFPEPEELSTGGYGLGIITTVMDDVSHRYDASRGNVLTLRVRCEGAAAT